jgi:hypothetical protein
MVVDGYLIYTTSPSQGHGDAGNVAGVVALHRNAVVFNNAPPNIGGLLDTI